MLILYLNIMRKTNKHFNQLSVFQIKLTIEIEIVVKRSHVQTIWIVVIFSNFYIKSLLEKTDWSDNMISIILTFHKEFRKYMLGYNNCSVL